MSHRFGDLLPHRLVWQAGVVAVVVLQMAHCFGAPHLLAVAARGALFGAVFLAVSNLPVAFAALHSWVHIFAHCL